MEIHKLKTAHFFKRTDGDGVGEPVLRCGEVVSRSGIYEAIHHNHEDGNTEGAFIVLRGDIVRPCQVCGDQICLRLIYAAPHISEDGDFASEQMISN